MGNDNLKPWKPGQSGNPAGRPTGSRNLRSIIRDLLEDKSVYSKMTDLVSLDKSSTPIEAIIVTLISKAIAGDQKSAEVLLKYGFDKDAKDPETEYNKIVVEFV